jgi:ribonuclease J
MVRNMTIAADPAISKVPAGVPSIGFQQLPLTPPDNKIAPCRPGRVWFAGCSRTHGQPRATVIEVGKGDTIILASSPIPGNENAVHRVINGPHQARRQRSP